MNNNKSLVESYKDLVNAAFLNYRADVTPNWDPFLSRKMEMLKMICARLNLMIRQKYFVLMKKINLMRITQKQKLHTTNLSDSEINSKIRSLDVKQRKIFDFIYNWANSRVKVECGTTSKQSTPFHLFLSSSGACGKLH